MKNLGWRARLMILAAIAILISALVAHTGIAWVAILSGFVASFGTSLFTKGEDKYWLTDIIACVIGAQMGWVAYLI